MDRVSRVQTVLRNVAFISLSSFISQAIGAITSIMIVNYLGLSLYDQYATAMLYMGMFSIMGHLGFNRVFLRDCSKNIEDTPRYFPATL